MTVKGPIQIDCSTEDARILKNAIGDHIRALEANWRRASRGNTVAIVQGDKETSEAYENVIHVADLGIKRARDVADRLAFKRGAKKKGAKP